MPEDVRQNLARLLEPLRPIAPKTSWVKPENLHVTLKFIGEVADPTAEEIIKTLALIPFTNSIEVKFSGLGFFPDAKRPRVFWAGVQASEELLQLVKQVELALESLGIAREGRNFSPHLTLARFREPRTATRLIDRCDSLTNLEFGTTKSSQFHLIQSTLKSSGSEYTTLQSFSLASEE